MSWYISFYCATRNKKTKMLYPLGPYDNKGKYYDVLCKSRTSHIWDQNEGVIEKAKFEEVSEELRTALKPETYENYFTEEEYGRYGGWIYIFPYHELGASNYIKKGYVLLEDLERSEDENSWFDGFSDVLTPVTYAKRLENEMKFGSPKPQKDCEGYDITPHSVADYTYHCWPDYDSLEWETHCIRQFMEMFLEYPGLPDDFEPVALSLGLYFAEHNKGAFADCFIEFSARPKLIKIKGETFAERLRYVTSFNEIANTNLEAVFDVILRAAVKNHVSQEEMPDKLIIISDMEFDACVNKASVTNFENAKMKYAAQGYVLPQIIFWNVASRNRQQPVTQNEQGVALISGATPKIFEMVAGGQLSPYAFMMEILERERYAKIVA